jgi:hypothetical protein
MSNPVVLVDLIVSNPIVRAWRRFWLCHWDQPGGGICLRRRWHREDCQGFTPGPVPLQWSTPTWSAGPVTYTAWSEPDVL